MIEVSEDWSVGIDGLVEEANRWLSLVLPADRAQRPKDAVNPRLVRHYTTQGLLPPAGREGRDARYTRRHLLALVALRRLMADGLSGKALFAALREKSEAELAVLAQRGSAVVDGLGAREDCEIIEDVDDAISYIARLKRDAAISVDPSGSRKSMSKVLDPKGSNLHSVPVIPPRRKAVTEQVVRLKICPGLELLVGERFQAPNSDEAWERLMFDIRASLGDATPS